MTTEEIKNLFLGDYYDRISNVMEFVPLSKEMRLTIVNSEAIKTKGYELFVEFLTNIDEQVIENLKNKRWNDLDIFFENSKLFID